MSYLNESFDRSGRGSLPDIKRAASGHSVGSRSELEFVQGSPRRRNRPYSAEDEKKMIAEMHSELKEYRDELKKKDELIAQIASNSTSTPRQNGVSSTFQRSYDAARVDALLSAGLTAESARGEVAALNCKIENLKTTILERERQIESKDMRARELANELNTSKETEARLSEMLRLVRDRVNELEGESGHLQSVAGDHESTVRSLKAQLDTVNEKNARLEQSIRTSAGDRNSLEDRALGSEQRYTELMSKLARLLDQQQPDVDGVTAAVSSLLEQNALMRSKVVTLSESMGNTELETKASRETIARLVAEVNRAQKLSEQQNVDLENARLERDEAVKVREMSEHGVKEMRERLHSNQRALKTVQEQLQLKEERIANLNDETRDKLHSLRTSQSELDRWRERLANALGTPAELQPMLEKVEMIAAEARDFRARSELLENKLSKLSERLESEASAREQAELRERDAEIIATECRQRVQSLDDNLAQHAVIRDGMKLDKEKYMKLVEELTGAMKVDETLVCDVGFDDLADALIARARQLTKMENNFVSDRQTRIYNLQRKVKRQKEQLASKELHLELLRKKISQLEENMLGKGELENERDCQVVRARKLQKHLEKVKNELGDARVENRELKARLLSASDLKILTMEQQKEIEALVGEVSHLETLKQKQSRKIGSLKEGIKVQEQESGERYSVNSRTIDSLSSELKMTKDLLEKTTKRERQLLDLRMVVSKMLGLNMDSLAIPDYEIVQRLEKLVQAYQTYDVSHSYLDQALSDVDDAIDLGYRDVRRAVSPARMHRRTRSISPVRVDPVSY